MQNTFLTVFYNTTIEVFCDFNSENLHLGVPLKYTSPIVGRMIKKYSVHLLFSKWGKYDATVQVISLAEMIPTRAEANALSIQAYDPYES